MIPNNAYGAFGGWRVSITDYMNPGSGRLASLLVFGGAQVSNNYLYRVQVSGHPKLNQMQTVLDMMGDDINNIGNANVTQTYLTGTGALNTACASTSVVRTSATGAGLVICSASTGIWEPIGTAVANVISDMPCNNDGQIATDVTNVGYIRKDNQYVVTNNAMGRLAINRQFTNVTDGMTSAKDSCPGGMPWAIYTPGTFLVNDTGYVNPSIEGNLFTAIDQGTVRYVQASARSSSTWYSGNDTRSLGDQLVGTLTTGYQC